MSVSEKLGAVQLYQQLRQIASGVETKRGLQTGVERCTSRFKIALQFDTTLNTGPRGEGSLLRALRNTVKATVEFRN